MTFRTQQQVIINGVELELTVTENNLKLEWLGERPDIDMCDEGNIIEFINCSTRLRTIPKAVVEGVVKVFKHVPEITVLLSVIEVPSYDIDFTGIGHVKLPHIWLDGNI